MSKRKYLVLFRSDTSCQPSEGPSPEQMQKMFAAYQEWMETFKDRILDQGSKLSGSGKVVTSTGVADGPFVESKELVGGYMILEADDYQGAVEVMQGCPGASAPGGSFEIRELMSM